MRYGVLCAAIALAAVPRAAGAQSLPITEQQVLQRLSPESPRVRAIRAGVDVARAGVLAAGRWPNPRIRVDREAAAGTTEYLTTVGQPLPITGIRGLEMRAASALADAAAARAEDQLRRARADLRLAFAHLVAAQSRERSLTTSRDRLRGVAEILSHREAAGDAAGFDRLRAEREVLDVEADLTVAAADRLRAQIDLASFLAAPVDPVALVAEPPVPAPSAVPDVDALMQRAESMRGDLLALRKETDAARWSGLAADRRRVPEPEVIAGTKSSSAFGGSLGSVLGVQATVPLFDRGRPEKALATARAAEAEAQSTLMKASLRVSVAGLRAAVTERRAAAERYRSAAMGSADQIERIAQVSYEAGERSILELLDAYRTTAGTRARQAQLDLAVREAEIELEFASGWEIN